MSLWTQIKYAINSTLGTKHFEPIDQMIIGSKSVVASDSVYHLFNKTVTLSQNDTDPSHEYDVETFRFPYSGTLRVKYNIKAPEGKYIYFTVYKNGKHFTQVLGSEYTPNNTTVYDLDITGNINDVIRLTANKYKIGSGKYDAYVTLKSVCATIKEGRTVLIS